MKVSLEQCATAWKMMVEFDGEELNKDTFQKVEVKLAEIGEWVSTLPGWSGSETERSKEERAAIKSYYARRQWNRK